MNFDVSLVTYFECAIFNHFLTLSVKDHDIFPSYIVRWNGFVCAPLLTPVPRLSCFSTAPTKRSSSRRFRRRARRSPAWPASPFPSKPPALRSTESKTRESTAFSPPTSSSPSRISPPRVAIPAVLIPSESAQLAAPHAGVSLAGSLLRGGDSRFRVGVAALRRGRRLRSVGSPRDCEVGSTKPRLTVRCRCRSVWRRFAAGRCRRGRSRWWKRGSGVRRSSSAGSLM